MRKYNIDANRNVSDLKLKVLANWEYNNLLLTCYDTALLWLADLYHHSPRGTYSQLKEMNLLTLVEVLGERSAFVKHSLKGYDRLYFIYELVYRNYFIATKKDVVEAIKTLDRIVEWWLSECSWTSLIELAIFLNPESAEKLSKMQNNEVNHSIVADMLGLKGSLANTWQLLEASDE